MYNIYVTNQTADKVYIPLQRRTISSYTSTFHSEIDRLTSGDAQDELQNNSFLNSYLVKMGFCMIPSQKTMSFTIGIVNDETHMYASLPFV